MKRVKKAKNHVEMWKFKRPNLERKLENIGKQTNWENKLGKMKKYTVGRKECWKLNEKQK